MAWRRAITTVQDLCLSVSLTCPWVQDLAAPPESAFRRQEIEAEVLRLLDTWMGDFNRLDIPEWEHRFHFPHEQEGQQAAP